MIFAIDTNTVFNSIQSAISAEEDSLTEPQVLQILEQIDNSIPGIIELITQDIEYAWRDEAIGAGGWGQKYAQAIKSKFDGKEGEIYLDEDVLEKGSNKPAFMFAMMMEKGVKSWSIKDALLKSEKAKVSHAGIKYIIIPFPVSAPRKEGQGKMSSKFGGREMTNDMHDIVKAGGRLGGGSVPVKNTSGTKNVDVSGLSKYQTRQMHEGYGVMRCVSEKSKGWQYPDVPPEPVFKSVLAYVNRRIGELLSDFCTEIVKANTSK